MTTMFVGQPQLHWVCQITARRGKKGGHAGQDDSGAEVLDGLGSLQLLKHKKKSLQLLYQLLLVHVCTKTEEIQISNGKEINTSNKYSVECRTIHLAAGFLP